MKESEKRTIIRMRNLKRKLFNLFDKDDNIVKSNATISDLSKIYQKLHLKTKEDYLGKSNRSRLKFINNNKEKYIGYYVEEII